MLTCVVVVVAVGNRQAEAADTAGCVREPLGGVTRWDLGSAEPHGSVPLAEQPGVSARHHRWVSYSQRSCEFGVSDLSAESCVVCIVLSLSAIDSLSKRKICFGGSICCRYKPCECVCVFEQSHYVLTLRLI